MKNPLKITLISDTHTLQGRMSFNIPDADVLIHAGDFMNCGNKRDDYLNFLEWFSSFPHQYKIFIAGNHDAYFQNNFDIVRKDLEQYPGLIYLQDGAIEIEGTKFYGSPWTPWFCNWAFSFPRDYHLGRICAQSTWAKIPDDTEVLITHGPPRGINDKVLEGERVGCEALRERIETLKKLGNLKLCVHGHIHEGYGIKKIEDIVYANPSIVTRNYEPINKPLYVLKSATGIFF